MNNKELRVTDDFRSNELSLKEGGETIKIIMKNGKILIYDKIKSVKSYSQKAKKHAGVAEIWHKDKCLYKIKK